MSRWRRGRTIIEDNRAQLKTKPMETYGVTHIGLVRERNEDRFLIREFENGSVLLAVADGMGGHAAGDRAAQITMESLADFAENPPNPEDELTRLAQAANRKILEEARQESSLEGMGSTLTAAFVKNGSTHWIHAGDSRLYLGRDNLLVQVSEDHTLLGLMLQEGDISREDARAHPMKNMLLNCVGREPFRIEMGTLQLQRGDLLLFTTDGLHDRVEEERIASIVHSEADLQFRLNSLVDAALTAGGRDNITVVALQT